jgi:hypothetical protein
MRIVELSYISRPALSGPFYILVMPGLVPGIHVFSAACTPMKTWMAGSSPAMTNE